MLGVLTGRWLQSERSLAERINGLFAAGALAMMTGLMWHWSFPIAKNIWTSSYVLFTAGCGAVALATCMFIIDEKKIIGWTKFFVVYGVNPLFAFVASGVIGRFLYTLLRVPAETGAVPLQGWLFEHLYAPWLEPRDASLLFALTWVAVFYVMLAVMYRRNIVIKL